MPEPEVLVSALGDGNCAFNAFALGLCQLVISGKLDKDANYEQRQAKIISLFEHSNIKFGKNWLDLKNYLQEQIKTKKDFDKLQENLGGNLRVLAIEIISEKIKKEKNAGISEDNLSQRLQNRLVVSFKDFKENKKNFDDMFFYNEFIKKKFEELKNEDNSEDQLKKWWDEQGLQKFLEEMKSKDKRRHAGDLELSELSDNFFLSIKYKSYSKDSKDKERIFLSSQENYPALYLEHNGCDHWDCAVKEEDSAWFKPLINNPHELTQNKLSGAVNSNNPKWKAFIKIKLENIASENKHIQTKFNDTDNTYEVFTASSDSELLKTMVQKTYEALSSNINNINVEINGPHKELLTQLCREQGFTVINAPLNSIETQLAIDENLTLSALSNSH